MAAQNLARFAALAGVDYELEVVDLRQHPERAVKDAVVVTPTLVKLSPPPRAMLIGGLADIAKGSDDARREASLSGG